MFSLRQFKIQNPKFKISYRSFVTGVLLLLSSVLFSQKNHFGSWSVINTKLILSEKWSVYNELQLRSQSFYNDFYYHEVKGGVAYSVNKNFSFLLGVGKYITYGDPGNFKHPLSANETRFWQQLTMNQYLERIKIEHRYRIEQRWFKTGYRNRYRYRLNVAVPINHNKIGPKTFYIAAFDEIFLTNKAPHFERNRFFFGTGYQLTKKFTIQPGYLYQYDFKNDIGTGKHFFQLTFSIEIDGHKSKMEKIPGNVD
jgi:long-subunit fatty acid transport protein